MEELKIQNCKYEFGKVSYDPETIKVPYGSRKVELGVDSYIEPEGYADREKQRWSKMCLKCGYKKYAYEKKPIIQGYEPDFN